MLRIVFSCLVAGMFTLLFNVRGKNVFFAAISGGISYSCYLLLADMGGFISIFWASCALTVYSELMARVRKAPTTIFLVGGMISIVPGGGLYRSMCHALEGNLAGAAALCYQSLLEAGAIAVGIIAVPSLVKIWIGLRRPKAPETRG